MMYESTSPSSGDEIGDSLRKWNQATATFYSDPLASLSFALRLQTHNGNNVPLGLYQDAECTIPATEDGHPVAAWRGEFAQGAVTATQADSQKQPMLLFEGLVPTLWFDGTDDYMEGVVSIARPSTSFILATTTGGANHNVVNFNGNAAGGVDYLFTSSDVMEVGRGGVSGLAATSATFLTWKVYSCIVGVGGIASYVNGAADGSSADTASFLTGAFEIGRFSEVAPLHLSGSIAAILADDSEYSVSDRELVEDYLATIHP